jgi:hypothetical protein
MSHNKIQVFVLDDKPDKDWISDGLIALGLELKGAVTDVSRQGRDKTWTVKTSEAQVLTITADGTSQASIYFGAKSRENKMLQVPAFWNGAMLVAYANPEPIGSMSNKVLLYRLRCSYRSQRINPRTANILFPVILLALRFYGVANVCAHRPISFLVFFAANMILVYNPIISAMNLKPGTALVIYAYLCAMTAYILHLAYIRYVKGIRLSELKPEDAEREIYKNETSGIIGVLHMCWLIGLLITICLDAASLAKTVIPMIRPLI